ncbi:hypothetical protein BDV95DRAFT_131873 [Massariosphaeria phaeospora]|uniref:Uncharacterized protein n=1 Tax=Massariosphaeria phaeospora TaxID=100035 RepID=A0A7C8IL11_9PLEO|nr:hypothetical protein BDV95DRAFT_131873 [Massariosphaeria phaeospora]
MAPTSTTLFFLFALLGLAAASPVRRAAATLQCHCVDFSPVSSPTACSIPDSQDLAWAAARAFAATHDLDVLFASQATISKVLQSTEPLPTSVAIRLSEGLPLPLDYQGVRESGSKMVCGMGNEVRAKLLENSVERDGVQSDLNVGRVVAVLMLVIIVYAAGDAVFTRRFRKHHPMQLSGHERRLSAIGTDSSDSSCAPVLAEKAAEDPSTVPRTPSQTDFS